MIYMVNGIEALSYIGSHIILSSFHVLCYYVALSCRFVYMYAYATLPRTMQSNQYTIRLRSIAYKWKPNHGDR